MKFFAAIITFAFLNAAPAIVFGSPTRVVMVPSTSTVDPWRVNGNMETYFRVSDRKAVEGPAVSPGRRDPGITVLGAALGLAAWKLKGEVGVDYTTTGPDVAERNPATMNAKIVLPEHAFKPFPPAIVAGIWNYWPKAEGHAANMVYGLLSYTPVAGRISVGGYHGAENALGGVETGILASWDKAVFERTWVGIDYIGGNNKLGSVNAGISYAFSKRSSLMLGYNLHTAREISGSNSVVVRAYFVF